MSTQQNSSEEIDLVQLFKLIGEGFTKIYNFISYIFTSIFLGLILFSQFIQKHFIKFVIASIIGVILGGYRDYISEPVYRSTMIVQPNFNSTQQLYNNIEFYNELAKQKEYKVLATALKISDKEAASISLMEIEAFSDDNQKLKQFSDFVVTLDSISRVSLSYEKYLENFNNINAKFHKIEFYSANPIVAKKSQNAIVRSIENNAYYSTKKTTNDLNIVLEEKIINDQLQKVDSLNKFYRELKLLELKTPIGTTGTNINLAGENKSIDRSEIVLLDREINLKNRIIDINNTKVDKQNIINVISDFPLKGSLVNDIFSRKIFLFPFLFIGILFLSLLVLALNRFLNNYNMNNKLV